MQLFLLSSINFQKIEFLRENPERIFNDVYVNYFAYYLILAFALINREEYENSIKIVLYKNEEC